MQYDLWKLFNPLNFFKKNYSTITLNFNYIYNWIKLSKILFFLLDPTNIFIEFISKLALFINSLLYFSNFILINKLKLHRKGDTVVFLIWREIVVWKWGWFSKHRWVWKSLSPVSSILAVTRSLLSTFYTWLSF